jgi:uncharacterized protein
MLLDSIKSDILINLKKGDSVRVETLRFLVAAIRNLAIEKYGAAGETKITNADVLDVVKKQVKTHRESVEAFEKAGRTELADRENAQLKILAEMMPQQMSDEDIRKIAAEVIKGGESNFGKLMGQVMAKVAGRADGGRVSLILKSLVLPQK